MSAPSITLSPQQSAALVHLQAVFIASQKSPHSQALVHSGWGHHLRTLESLERLGLCTVTLYPPHGHVRNGRFIKGKASWTATVTDAGLRHRIPGVEWA